MTGKIKHQGFQFERGFGFVAADDGLDYFLHANNCQFEWNESITGATVEFEIETTQRGFAAVNVRVTA
jgi:cold shock CspA family protein